jgi:hypothetical protein
MAQTSLGVALEVIGEREGGTARLEEAVTAYREALEEWTGKATPYWHNADRANALLAKRRAAAASHQ